MVMYTNALGRKAGHVNEHGCNAERLSDLPCTVALARALGRVLRQACVRCKLWRRQAGCHRPR